MAKIIPIYRNYTTTEIKERSSVPIQASISISGSNILFSDILISRVASILGIGLYNLASLCTSGNINIWSCFSPYIRSYSAAGTLTSIYVSSLPTSQFKLGDFAGYNHSAEAPGWRGNKANAELDVYIDSGTAPIFTASFYIGEVIYPNAQGVALTIWNDQNELNGFTIINLNTIKDRVDIDCQLSNNLTQNKTFTGKIFIVDNLSQFLQSGGNVLCRVPNVDDYTVDVIVRQPTQFILDAGDWTVVGATYSLVNGTVSFTNATVNRNITALVVTGKLIDINSQVVGTYTFYNGSYTANTTLNGGTGYLGMAPIPSFGYIIRLEFLESE